jgi:hypothetical protein
MARSAMRSVAAGLVASWLVAGAASAEERPWPPAPGSRIRVTAPGVLGERLVGQFVAFDEDGLRIQPKGKTEAVVIPRTAITRLELSGRPSRRGLGAGVGLLVGMGAAVVVGVFAGDDCASDSFICFDKPTTGLMASVLTIPLGIAFGAALAPGEKWETYSPERVRVAIGPAPSGGVRGRVSLRF